MTVKQTSEAPKSHFNRRAVWLLASSVYLLAYVLAKWHGHTLQSTYDLEGWYIVLPTSNARWYVNILLRLLFFPLWRIEMLWGEEPPTANALLSDVS